MTIWQVENGQSIQAVIVGAADGDTIVVDAGTYAENLTIDKAVTILGANAGIAGTATRGAETIIQGTTTVTAIGPVTIDGIEVLNTSNSGTQFIGVSVHTAADVTIENSVFFSTVPMAPMRIARSISTPPLRVMSSSRTTLLPVTPPASSAPPRGTAASGRTAPPASST